MNAGQSPLQQASRAARALGCAAWILVAACAADEPKRNYDLRAGDAATALRQFSEVSGREILFAAEVVRGVRTNALRGEFTALEALKQMLAGTKLHAIPDGSGAIAVRRISESKPPSKPPAILRNAGDAPSTTDPPERDVLLRFANPMKPLKRKNPITLLVAWLALAITPAHSADNAPAGAARQTTAATGERAQIATETGNITGRILNGATGQYLRSALVSIKGTNISTVAESGGTYTLSGVPAGDVIVRVSYFGLDDAESLVIVRARQVVVHDVTLQTKEDESGVIRLGEFRVVSEREGNAKAIQDQRHALEIKTVIATDAFGEVSEGNVGEFLKMMPGVMLDYVAADARTLSIGGLDPQYAAILMDGMPIANAGSSNIAVGRAFEFEQLSISSIETIELSKTPTPDISGSALAGVVNLRSKGAFDRKGRQFRYSANGQLNSHYMTLGKRPGPDEHANRKVAGNLSLEYSDVYLKETLGVIAGFNFARTFVDQNQSQMSYAADNDLTNNDTEVLRMTVWSMVDAPKSTDRKSFSTRLDYKAGSNLSLMFSANRSEYTAYNYQRNVQISLPNAVNGPRATDPKEPGVEFSMLSQTSRNAQIQPHLGSAFVKHGATTTYAGRAEYRNGAFLAEIAGNASFATNKLNDVQFGFTSEGNSGWVLGDFRWHRLGGNDPAFNLTQLSGPDWKNPDSYRANPANIANPVRRRTDLGSKEYRYTLKTDMRYNWRGWRVPVNVKWGGAVGEQIRNVRAAGTSPRYNYLGPDGIAGTGDEWWQVEPLYRLRNLAGGNVNDVFMIDRYAMGREYRDHPERFVPTPGFNNTEAGQLQSALLNTFKVKEQTDALYTQFIVKVTDRLDIAPGFRYERTRSLGRAAADIGVGSAKQLLTGNRNAAIPTDTVEFIQARYGKRADNRSEYNTPLKYLHATYRLTDGTVFRASFNDSITRPALNNLTRVVTDNPDATPLPVANIPNRELKPEYGRNLFVSAERYFPRGGGYLTISGARRDIEDLIRTVTYEQGPDETTTVGDLVFAGPYRITTVDNVAKVHLTTGEISYRQNMTFLPGIWRRLSLSANYTRLHYDHYNNFFRPKQFANGSLSFTHRGLSLWWKTVWYPMRRTGAINATTGYANMLSERLQHDIEAAYRFSRYATVYVTARNLFNQPERTFLGPNRTDIMTRYSDYGTIWNIGVRGTF
jgi:iron complex outermembrane recepter protein